ncbi:hypothetical protein BGZ49_007413 [Haplosporangium sp. Z 27]|nr:hypothetical protein BGZ49_007413 [Haplosporangium sp. Z 27]
MGSSSARKLFKSFKYSDPSPAIPKFSTSHKSKSTPALVSSSSAMPFNPQPISTERVNDLVVDESSIPSEDLAIPSIPLRTSSIIPSISEPIIPKSLHSAPMPLPIDSSSRISIASSSRGSIASSRQLPSPPASPLLSPARYSVYCSQPASRCSSMNSAISFSSSLDHRSMARVNPPKREKTTVVVSKRISDPEKPLPEIPKPHKTPESTTATTTSTTTTTTSTTTPSPSYPFLKVASRSNSSAERAAFLSSAPVRSRISVSPRYKNMTSITSTTSKTSGLTSKSTPSFFTSSMSTSTLPLTMGISYHTAGASTQINLDKRRWSNDSTRGLHGSGSSTSLSLSLSSVSASSPNSSAVDLNSATQYTCSRYNSDDDDEDGDFELENGNDTHNDYKYFNVQRNYKAVKSQQNGKKKSKLNISLFGFMMKNKQTDASL